MLLGDLATRGTLPEGLGCSTTPKREHGVQNKDEATIYQWLRCGDDLGLQKNSPKAVDVVPTQSNLRTATPWHGTLLPGEYKLELQANAEVVFEHLGIFFHDIVPAAVSSLSWTDFRLEAVAFMNYAPVSIEASLFAGDDTFTVLVLKHIACSDVVRFFQVSGQLSVFLGEKGLSVTKDMGLSSRFRCAAQVVSPFDDELDDFADFHEVEAFEARSPWHERIAAVATNLGRNSALVREEAAQALATWAEGSPECRRWMAQELIGGSMSAIGIGAGLEESWRTVPISQAYPLAVAMKFTSQCPEAAAVLEASPFMSWVEHVLAHSETPSIISRELAEVSKLMRVANGSHGCGAIAGQKTSNGSSTKSATRDVSE